MLLKQISIIKNNQSVNSIFWSFILFLFAVGTFSAQTKPAYTPLTKKIIQFSGVVVGEDSLRSIPYASLIVKNTSRGTISDYFGFFSLVAQTLDTIEFSALGYKKMQFIISDTLSSNKYSIIQVMQMDTILLKETVVYPWPTKEQFKQAFLRLDPPDTDYDRAAKNLSLNEMNKLAHYTAMDGSMNYKQAMQNQYAKLYHAGQLPPNNLLNPVAWAKFIDAWRRGDFKKKN
ncbi:MAG: carboxypeptidase-like regulatory domain-containing protein [Bacteroidetes bacterium]|nr:carboxypeptidase-like regulatory domain-containing protein [Bacteroidota bacterium]